MARGQSSDYDGTRVVVLLGAYAGCLGQEVETCTH